MLLLELPDMTQSRQQMELEQKLSQGQATQEMLE
jgi:hypothetical protein